MRPTLTFNIWRPIAMTLVAFATVVTDHARSGDALPQLPAVEEELPLTREEVLDLAKDMDVSILRTGMKDILPPKEQLAEILKPGQWSTAVALGKALFWDRQLGDDGQACASCHFHAGADIRRRNQLNGGLPAKDGGGKVDPTKSGGIGGPAYAVNSGDFPFHALKDPAHSNSEMSFDTDDVMGSQGTACKSPDHIRATTARNAPTVINAIFQFRSFWDGRANHHFNGVTPFGRRESADPNTVPKDVQEGAAATKHHLLRVISEKDGQTGRTVTTVRPTLLDLQRAALASQAVGPPVNDVEMSCITWPQLGRKMVVQIPRPLFGQQVHPDDSVLGPYRHGKDGLNVSYRQLIQRAFRPSWWKDPRKSAELKPGEYPLIEHNFSLFFGIAVLAYESTLISDRSPFDRHIASLQQKPGGKALEGMAALGFSVFMDRGKCVACHRGPDLTASGFDSLTSSKEHREQIELMRMHEERLPQTALYDGGFYNLGVRPSGDDLGVDGDDPHGHPLSFTKQYLAQIKTGQSTVDEFSVDPCGFAIHPCEPIATHESVREAVKGSFKTAGLRNIELTGPYMHTGGMATLDQVIEFYDRGGDFQNVEQSPDIEPLGLNAVERNGLVAFLKSLTDERVRCEQAPFDHPSLRIPHGYSPAADGTYREEFIEIPAVGKRGRARNKLACLASFDAQLGGTALKGGTRK
ncbi:MAG: Cytochrome c peroxidase [Nitrospira sp.]|jgi:cytochrome c peroxidase|nr:MAG: Cytochrome c peroxidase [Nitrospira sp.]